MNKNVMIAISAVLGVIILLGVFFMSSYNSLVQKREEANSKWAQVENQLKRRADLIPNLVNTVKGFAKQEEDVLIKVVEARNGISNAKTPEEYAKANEQLTKGLNKVNVLVEKYPEIKSDKGYLKLQTQLEGTENRIAVARMDYNEAVKTYNSTRIKFPVSLCSKIFGFHEKKYFEVAASDRELPKVNF